MTAYETAERSRGVRSIGPVPNPMIRRLLRLGVPISSDVLLTVRGRSSGEPRTFPVALMKDGGRRYVFATFGEVNWVRNLRVAGRAVLRRRGGDEEIVAMELLATRAATVIRDALAAFLGSPLPAQLLRHRYDVSRGSSQAEYLEEARRHPVFDLWSVA